MREQDWAEVSARLLEIAKRIIAEAQEARAKTKTPAN